MFRSHTFLYQFCRDFVSNSISRVNHFIPLFLLNPLNALFNTYGRHHFVHWFLIPLRFTSISTHPLESIPSLCAWHDLITLFRVPTVGLFVHGGLCLDCAARSLRFFPYSPLPSQPTRWAVMRHPWSIF